MTATVTAGTSQVVALRSRAGVALIAATVLASGVASYDANVVKVAVPAIGRAFGVSVTALQWTLTSYLITVGGLCVAAALVTALFVSNANQTGHRILARAPEVACAKPISTQEVTS
jgi:hypothetical protein